MTRRRLPRPAAAPLAAALLLAGLVPAPSYAGAPLAAPDTAPARVAATAGLLVDTDGDGLDDTLDGCVTVAAPTPTGCPAVPRRITLTWLAGVERLQARVTSPVEACSARAQVRLFRERPGGSDVLLASEAAWRGRQRFRVPRPGRYYVLVAPSYSSGVAECGKAVSRTVRAR